MPSSLPPVFARDLARLLALPCGQLVAAAGQGTPIYGFLILDVQCRTDGTWCELTVTRSGVAVEVGSEGRIVPARRVG